MPVDTENIRKAFNKFQEDDFIGAKEIIKQEIRAAKDKFLKDKIGLEKDPEQPEKEETQEDETGE